MGRNIKNIMNTPGGNSRYGHPGGSNTQILNENEPKFQYYANSALWIIQNSHKNTFKTKRDTISSKLMTKQWGLILYMFTPGGQIPTFSQKMTPNIGIMQTNSSFRPFHNTR